MLDSFLSWFFEFMSSMLQGVWRSISNFFLGIVDVFNFPKYFSQFAKYKASFNALEWILSILSFILAFAVWAGIVFLIVILVRKYIRFRKSIVGTEDILEEMADLHKEVSKLTNEKERMLQMLIDRNASPEEIAAFLQSIGRGVEEKTETTEPADIPEESTPDIVTPEATDDKDQKQQGPLHRFPRLTLIDEKYATYIPPEYDRSMSLHQLCEDVRNFACSQRHLFYDQKVIRLMFAGLSCTKMILLQGISGTGKTSLPYMLGKYFLNDATITSVQPSWRDRTELLGYFNEFSKKFNETEVLRRIYESGYNDDINIIVLDEMNIARVEYYFAEMLSILEMPDPAEWKLALVPSTWEGDPLKLKEGMLQIPPNVWYIGTANNDDSTFAVSDKVYDRAFVINLDSKGVPFEAPEVNAKSISYSYIDSLYQKAIAEHPVSDEILEKISKLDFYVIDHFRVAFGNRIMKQLKMFVPVYVACGGNELEGLDYILATKVFRKFESLNLSLIRDELKGLIAFLNANFGKDVMKECIAFLRRLEKTY